MKNSAPLATVVVALLAALLGPARPAAAAGALWLGNDCGGNVYKTDTTGTVLQTIPAGVTGIASDGTFLYFSNCAGNTTKRTLDGTAVLASFTVAPAGSPTEDLAWDSKRQRLWRIDHNPASLVKINPTTGTAEATFSLPTTDIDPGLTPRGGLGVAYDGVRDLLYLSFCRVGCSNTEKGVVLIASPDTGTITGELFRTTGFMTGGLGYDPVTDTLWMGSFGSAVGSILVVRNMTLAGGVISTFPRPAGGGFVDGLEFVSSTVVIGRCDTGVDNMVLSDASTIQGRINQCAADAGNHGDFVSCVAHLTNDLKGDGIITGAQKGAIVSCAAQANIP